MASRAVEFLETLRVSWSSCYQTSRSAEERRTGHPSRRFGFWQEVEIEERVFVTAGGSETRPYGSDRQMRDRPIFLFCAEGADWVQGGGAAGWDDCGQERGCHQRGGGEQQDARVVGFHAEKLGGHGAAGSYRDGNSDG
jgi:hypothetical protein